MDRGVSASKKKAKSYEQVEMTPLGPASSSVFEEEPKSQTMEWLEYAQRKLTALLWIAVACAITWYIKLPDVIMDSYTPGNTKKQLAIFWFNIGLAGFAGWCSMVVYLVIWLKYVQKIDVEWEEYSPRSIPVATICALSSLLGCAPRTTSGPTARTPAPRSATAEAPNPARARPLRPSCPLACRFVVSFWPVWGFLTLPIVWFLFLGALNLAHFSPL